MGNMYSENKVAASKIVDGRVLTDRQTHKHTDRTNNIIVAKIGNYKREKKIKSKFGHYGNRTHDIQIINTTLYPTELTCHLMYVYTLINILLILLAIGVMNINKLWRLEVKPLTKF